jgi:hypothetical protein
MILLVVERKILRLYAVFHRYCSRPSEIKVGIFVSFYIFKDAILPIPY